MAENNQFDSRGIEQEDQKVQFRSFVEQVTGGGSSSKNESLQDQSRTADEQNRMIDQHNLRK